MTLADSTLFAGLPPEAVRELDAAATVVELAPGDVLMAEGDPADAMFHVVSGELEVHRTAPGGGQLLVNTSGPGDLVGELGLLSGRPRSATLRARTPVTARRFGAELLDRLVTQPGAARALIAAAASRLERDEAAVRLHDRRAALGRQAAGLLHEVNNPASAIRRGAAQLRGVLVADTGTDLAALAGRAGVPDDPLDRADLESAVAAVLADAGVDRGWEVADALVRLGVDPASLADALQRLPEERRGRAAVDLARSGQVRRLLDEISVGADYLAKIASGGRSLAYSAEEALGLVDVHAGLEDALVLVGHKVPPRVDVRRDLAADPSVVQGWASRLALVWTNLLDNAMDAVPPGGRVTVATRSDEESVTVDVENTGAPVPPDVLDKVFDPFFTTKPLGEGTGLGLAAVWSEVTGHHGTAEMTSAGGVTRVRVVLPRTQEEPG